MRPCKNCGTPLQNNAAECPNCGAIEEIKKRSTIVVVPTDSASAKNEVRAFWTEYLTFPILTGLLFGGFACAAIGPWGLVVGIGVFLAVFTFRFFIDVI